ncbi:MAG: PEP/pyruvate-binding domain-containing protein [Desulfobacterales bacterium]|nr:PEP/pyruvate-binding domain-containing protein [Desulfobacterales bacterium]
MVESKALEVNLASYQVDVAIDPKYAALQEIMSGYYGLAEGLTVFLKELSHPYRNWLFIVKEARGYSLDYFHLFIHHPRGPQAAALIVDIFANSIREAGEPEVKTDAADNLLLFLQKVIKESGAEIGRFMPVLNSAFNQIRQFKKGNFFLFLKSFYQIKRLAELLIRLPDDGNALDLEPVNSLLFKYLKETYAYWLKEEDPLSWFSKEVGLPAEEKIPEGIFRGITHGDINELNGRLDAIAKEKKSDAPFVLKRLIELPSYQQIVAQYRGIPQKLFAAGSEHDQGNMWKLVFIFHTMNIAGLSIIHEEALRDINRTLTWLIGHEDAKTVQQLVQKTFSILQTRTHRFPETALNCVLNMGKAVYKTDEIDLVNAFIDSMIDLGFQAPMIGGVGNDWQIKVNSAHILNIRTWLELTELNPKWSPRLLSALIIHLSLCGVFIKDTDLFPRDITHLLNSDIGPVYNLVKQMARLFPTFFNDIGAEGELRDISTNIDEISNRKDVLIHFLRKQSHVESSNRIILFMDAVLNFWKTKDKSGLKPFIPPSLYDQVKTRGPFIDGVHRVLKSLTEKGVAIPGDFLTDKSRNIDDLLKGFTDGSGKDLERVNLAISFYRLLQQKYSLDAGGMEHYMAQLRAEAFPDLIRLKEALAEKDLKKKISGLLEYLEILKKTILSVETFEIREDIYKKRHFTVDIPSMYGSYHEIKFDALGLTFRIEALINVLFEELVDSIDLGLITKATFFQVYERLKLFNKALKLDGISSDEIERQLDFLVHSLEVRGFTFTQYLDIFKGFAQAVKNIINDYFNNIHERNLDRILTRLPVEQILPKYLPRDHEADPEKVKHRVSEIFFRERIALSLGLQQMDLFLSRILNTLFLQAEKVPKDKLQTLLLYDHRSALSSIDQTENRVSGIIHLGNKGLNMVKLKQYGLPVPPGFIITTEVFRSRDVIKAYQSAERNLREQIAQQIAALDKKTHKTFGDPKNPLLFSVRSGSSISQPGMMDTFLDVGINEEIAAGIAAQSNNEWFAWDNYRRFLQCYGMAFDLERDDFDAIIDDFKQRFGVPFKRSFTGAQMKQVALAYKALIQDTGIVIEESPYEQLYVIIGKVLDSWDSSKAKAYRKIMGISDDWGTAVTIQTMVYGNISKQSGTGVIFTHNPRWPGDSLRLWGDFTLENQGEDVVSGLVKTLPVSVMQQEIENRDTDITLETHFPEIYNKLEEWANDLIYEKGWSPQEMEFTFESPAADHLYLLQTRDMAIRERKDYVTFDLDGAAEQKFLGHGIGVSGGAMSGRIVFSLDEIDKWRGLEPATALILLRSDTVPDDIREIFAADGLLTARGGLTSHAAVVAHRLGKTCVVGCGNLICHEKEQLCVFGAQKMKTGDFISIDGQQGTVYQGLLKMKAE